MDDISGVIQAADGPDRPWNQRFRNGWPVEYWWG